MGCRASKMCCPRPRNKSRQKAKQSDQTSRELNDLTDDGSSDLLQKIKDHEQELRNLLQRHQEEKIALEDVNKAKLETRERELLDQARRDAEVEIEKRLSEQTSIIKSDMERKCAELQESHSQQNASLTETYQKLTTSLQETVAGLNAQLASFREKMKRVEDSVLNQDYKRHVQDYGSPGQFWEQELQSLHFVIEMKNELIQEQDKRLLIQKDTMDRNVILEEKVRALQQETEALRVQTQNQAMRTIRLTEELLSTQVALEKEQQLREQLQHDKEQHLYRAVNGDGPPPFSLPVANQEVSIMVT
ncbi:coiled-coil domain-containing protein 69 [Pseudophryne corroboree]|uniref:coiled-coil domain-containing protein 69 n=1 Tax=Pseudophryne corroboree TaxID=495146 RepID=UPI0030818DDD